MTIDEFNDMDAQELMKAIEVSGMPKELVDRIWKKKHKPFEVFDEFGLGV